MWFQWHNCPSYFSVLEGFKLGGREGVLVQWMKALIVLRVDERGLADKAGRWAEYFLEMQAKDPNLNWSLVGRLRLQSHSKNVLFLGALLTSPTRPFEIHTSRFSSIKKIIKNKINNGDTQKVIIYFKHISSF